MDVTPYLEHQIAARALFDLLPQRRTRPRFMLPTDDGSWRVVTWDDYATQVRRIGLFLAAHDLEPGDRACIAAPNRVEWIAAALGIQAVGGVMVPVYPNSTADQMAYVVEHSDARFVFVDTPALLGRIVEEWPRYANVERVVLLSDDLDLVDVFAHQRERGGDLPAFAEVAARTVRWSQAQWCGRGVDADQPERFEQRLEGLSLDQPGLMLYTSGTTGRPKGVPLTHRNTGTNGTDWLRCNAPLIEEGMVDMLWLPMSHIFGFGEACLGNTLGWVSYLCDPASVLPLMPEVRPNAFMSVPRYYEKLAQAATTASDTAEGRRKALQSLTGGQLRFCLSGGAGLKREVKERFHECGLLIIEGYGLTEASPTLTLNRPDAFRFDSVGKPLPSVELKLAEDGEILARGPSIFGGYHKDADASSEAFTSDGWLKTGDIGRWTDDGFLKIVDRKKEILVTAGGKNVPPANIELRFADDPFVTQVVVYGDGKPYLTAGVWVDVDAIGAHLERQDAGETSPEQIQKLVQQRVERVNAELPRYQTIKKFVVMDTPLTVENGLLTATLKVRRKRVYEAYGERLEALYG